MKVFQSVEEWRAHPRQGSLGFVPTMGALHDGHLSLVRQSRRQNDETAVSIFVNPTQFDDPEDLNAYPRTLEDDLARLEGVDYVLLPTPEQMYPRGYRYKVSENELSRRFCGAHRPGHFDGMLTVVLKLLLLVKPTRAYFGEKDYQQLRLVQGMVEDFFLDIEVVPGAIVRDPDGLAMSSRNVRLGEHRAKAARFPQLLQRPDARAALEEEGFEVDYVEEFEGRKLGAVRIGGVRLIDNV